MERAAVAVMESQRLLLRPMRAEDTDDLLRVFGDPRVMAAFGEPPFTPRQMTRWVERNLAHQCRHGFGLFTLVLKASGEVIGDCGLTVMDVSGRQEVELGYDLAGDYWNRGLATEAATSVRDYAFTTLGLTRLISLIRQGNFASRRVAEKIGMRFEADLIEHGVRYWLYQSERSGFGLPTPTGTRSCPSL